MVLVPLLAGLIAAACPVAAASADAPDPTAPFRWRSRLVVVLAPSGADPRLAEQRRILAAAGRAVADRDLVVLEAVGEGAEAVALRRRFGVAPDAFRSVLVGKDGGAKLVSEAPLATEALFGEIDAMPMRRDEMRTRGR